MKLSAIPQLRYAKALAIAGAAFGLMGSGALVEHWRMGKRLAEVAQKSTAEKLVRQSALTERQQKAMRDALEITLESHRQLKAERAKNARLVTATAIAAPKTPEYACRELALPESYLETFRQ